MNTIRQLIRQTLKESSLGTLSTTIKVNYQIDMTKHASERQLRHYSESGVVISSLDILNLLQKAIPKLTNELIQNYIDLGDEVVLSGDKTKLNIVGILDDNSKDNNVNFIVKTVMIKPNFHPKDTTQLFIKE